MERRPIPVQLRRYKEGQFPTLYESTAHKVAQNTLSSQLAGQPLPLVFAAKIDLCSHLTTLWVGVSREGISRIDHPHPLSIMAALSTDEEKSPEIDQAEDYGEIVVNQKTVNEAG